MLSVFPPFVIMLAICLLYIVFIILRYIPSIPSFLRVFFLIIKGCWIFQSLFLHLMRWSCDLLFLILFLCCIVFIDLHMLNHPCIPRRKPVWSWCMMYNVLSNSVSKYFIENFGTYLHQDNRSIILFFLYSD
jgi:hypothetical protein